MSKPAPYATEAELIRAFLDRMKDGYGTKEWTAYPETAGWDLLLVHSDGYQIGIEAKLILNAKVIDQALKDQHSISRQIGPDYRAVLVPTVGTQHHMARICAAVGLGLITMRDLPEGRWSDPSLPDERWEWRQWPNWLPAARCPLPDYVPDVEAGHSSPVKLTPWKIKAIRLMVLLDRRGVVTRRDMQLLKISPSRWTDPYGGFLTRAPGLGGYVRGKYTPDLRAQHPVNYAEIEADFDAWAKDIAPDLIGKAVNDRGWDAVERKAAQ